MIQRVKATAEAPETLQVWWLNPAVAFSVPMLVAGFIAYQTSAASYLYFWRTPKYFDLSCFSLLIAAVGVFLCGCLLGTARRREGYRRPAEDWTVAVPWSYVRRLFKLSFVLTVVAYVIWFGIGIKNGLNLQVILAIIHADNNATWNLRETYLSTIPGVTTAAELGLAVIVLGVPLGVATGWRNVRWKCGIVLLLGFVRAFLNSERLALIELLVPFVVSFVWLRPMRSRWLRLLTQCAPIVGVTLLYLFFGLSEFFRSWSNFYAGRESDFWSFIGLRLMGYYATALNNGALLWRVHGPLSLRLPAQTVIFLWRFPLLKNVFPILFPSLGFVDFPSHIPDQHYTDLLRTSANPEFNNPSGIYLPFVDFGATGGLLYWLLCGLVCGYLYKEFKKRNVAGVFLYPALYISLIEAARVLYWGDGRFFPPMFLLVVSVLFVLRKRDRTLPSGSVLPAKLGFSR